VYEVEGEAFWKKKMMMMMMMMMIYENGMIHYQPNTKEKVVLLYQICLSITARIKARLNRRLGCVKLQNRLLFTRVQKYSNDEQQDLRQKRAHRKIKGIVFYSVEFCNKQRMGIESELQKFVGRKKGMERERERLRQKEKWSEINCGERIWWQYDIT
jgi:hypothetical protein